MHAAVYEKLSTLKVFRVKFLYAFLLLYIRSFTVHPLCYCTPVLLLYTRSMKNKP